MKKTEIKKFNLKIYIKRFIAEISQNGLKSIKVCTALNYSEYLLILAPNVIGGIFIAAFASLVGILYLL